MSIVAIVNPAAGRGHASQIWTRVRAHLSGDIQTWETRHPRHASELTSEAIKLGAGTIVAVGGDGAINEVLNGFFEHGKLISAGVRLGLVPHGTGSDFSRALHLPDRPEQLAAIIQAGTTRQVDLLHVRYTTLDGSPASRYGINVTSFGMGGAVASRVNQSSKRFGTKLSFLLATLRTAVRYSGSSISMCLDRSKTIEAKITNVAIGNGQYHGAGMQVCPRAVIDDGLFDVTVIESLPLLQLVRGLPLLFNGNIYRHAKVHFFRGTLLSADSAEPVLIEIDGEPIGRLPIEISVMPRAMNVLAPRSD